MTGVGGVYGCGRSWADGKTDLSEAHTTNQAAVVAARTPKSIFVSADCGTHPELVSKLSACLCLDARQRCSTCSCHDNSDWNSSMQCRRLSSRGVYTMGQAIRGSPGLSPNVWRQPTTFSMSSLTMLEYVGWKLTESYSLVPFVKAES